MVNPILSPDAFQAISRIADSPRPPEKTTANNPDNLVQAAKDFEAAFIGQMLKFSGLAEALTTGGGEDMSAFTDFYIEKFAENIVEGGGFGLADKFYNKLKLEADFAEGQTHVELTNGE